MREYVVFVVVATILVHVDVVAADHAADALISAILTLLNLTLYAPYIILQYVYMNQQDAQNSCD